MKVEIPDFVLKNNAKESDWIEEHDLLKIVGDPCPYHKKNQEDWWLLNYKIRNLFSDIEREIRELTRTGKKPSIKCISWTHMAKRLRCDRGTLQHKKRITWVKSRRESIEKLIKELNSLEEKKEAEIDEIEELKIKLNKSRNTAAELYKKYNEAIARNKDLTRLIGKREEKIDELYKTIEQVQDQYKSNAQQIAKTIYLHK